MLPFLLLGVLRLGEGPGLFAGDYAHYLLHAQALADGRAYTDIGYIFTEYDPYIGPRVQPPGVPILLFLVSTLAGFDRTVMRATVLLAGLVFLLLAGRYFSRDAGLAAGLAVVLLTGVNPHVVEGATNLLSDLPFAACVWGLLILYDGDTEWTAGRIALASVLLAASLTFRLAGMALLPAVGLYWLLNRDREGHPPLVPLLVLGLGAGAAVLLTPLGDAVSGQMTLNPLEALTLDVRRLWMYRMAVSSSLLYPFPANLANDAYHVAAGGLVLLGVADWARNRWRSLLFVFCVVYVGMLSSISVMAGRYLWVLVPVIGFGLVNGLRVLVLTAPKWLGEWSRDAARAGAGRTALGVAGVLVLLQLTLGPTEPVLPGLEDRAEAQELFDYFRSLPADTEPRVVFVRPRILAWESGVDAMASFAAAPDTLLAEWSSKGITHVVTGGFGLDVRADSAARRIVDAQPDRLEEVFENGEFTVYRFLPGAPRGGDEVP